MMAYFLAIEHAALRFTTFRLLKGTILNMCNVNSSSKSMPSGRRICGPAIGLIALVASSLSAQSIGVPPRGTVPTGSYTPSEIETVDNASGNVSLRIPITALPAGRNNFTWPLSLIYNSAIIARGSDNRLISLSSTDPSDSGGWRYSYTYQFTVDYVPPNQSTCFGSNSTKAFYRYRLVTPDGSSHVLYLLSKQEQSNQPGYYAINAVNCVTPYEPGPVTFHTRDGSYISMVWSSAVNNSIGNGTWTVYLPDGTQVTGVGYDATSIRDRNSNGFSISKSGAGDGVCTPSDSSTSCGSMTTLRDDLGRTILIQHANGQDVITQEATSTASGTNNYQVLKWTVSWGLVAVPADDTHAYNCADPNVPSVVITCRGGTGAAVVTGATLPTQYSTLSYVFGYSTGVVKGLAQWGQLSSVTLPSGASVQYVYNFPSPMSQPTSDNAAPLISIYEKTLTWTDDNSTSHADVTGYAFTSTSSTITGPDGGQTSYAFSPPRRQVTGIQMPTGDSVSRVWSSNVPYGAIYSWSAVNPVLQSETTTFAGGATALTKSYTYDRNGNVLTLTEAEGITASSRLTTNTYQRGAGAASASLGTGGGAQDDANAYWNVPLPNLLGLVLTRIVNGSPGSNAGFEYDGGGSLSRGNVTKVKALDTVTAANETAQNWYDTYTGDKDYSSLCTGASTIGIHGNLTLIKNAAGNTTVFCYDANSDRVIRRVEAANSSTDARTFTYVYDSRIAGLWCCTFSRFRR